MQQKKHFCPKYRAAAEVRAEMYIDKYYCQWWNKRTTDKSNKWFQGANKLRNFSNTTCTSARTPGRIGYFRSSIAGCKPQRKQSGACSVSFADSSNYTDSQTEQRQSGHAVAARRLPELSRRRQNERKNLGRQNGRRLAKLGAVDC